MVPLFFPEKGDGDFFKRIRLAEYPDDQALFDDSLKLINRRTRRELYHLEKDKFETHDLSETMKEDQEKLIARASRLREQAHVYGRTGKEVLPEVTPEMIEELKALGYVGQ